MEKENKLEKGTVLILKKDFPPFPIGTEFTVDYSDVSQEMILNTPKFGKVLSTGEMIPSRNVGGEYAKAFEKFGGWQEWFEIRDMIIEEWSSHCVKFKGKSLNYDIIEKL